MEEMFGAGRSFRRRVLVVDDELLNRRLLGHIVSRDYDVLYAENGVEAMEQIRKNVKTLSLVMLDLLMPEKDGYEVLEEMRTSHDLKRIPVIVLTSEKTAEVKSLSLGAADFISKPYDMPEVILARVRRSIELAESYKMLNRTEHDSLTGLLTREFFMEYCERHDSFYPDMEMDAVMVNINKFHVANELHGRAFGDEVLKKLARAVGNMAVRTGGIACRCVGDGFYLYVPHCDDYAPFIKECEDSIRDASLSIRVGVYANADRNIETERRFDRAANACGKRTNSLSASFAYYDTALYEKELLGERLIREMGNAIETKQFKVYFQPKYNVTGDKPVLSSAEALIRWIHPELGFISPGEFIPLFEGNGLINKLDHYVWRESAAQIRRIKDEFGVTVPISVNVSRIDIYDPELENILLAIVKENGIDTSELLLEVTESAYTDNSDQIIETVEKLRADGFRIEMDDFGTGYSSLNMLSAMPIDALKLDMRFVRNICENEKDMRMVEFILDIAEYLEVSTIAEGVETEEQYLLLKEAGCDVIQGYYFSRPVPSDIFENTVKEQLT